MLSAAGLLSESPWKVIRPHARERKSKRGVQASTHLGFLLTADWTEVYLYSTTCTKASTRRNADEKQQRDGYLAQGNN